MKNQTYHPIIGLEVHAELKTKSKMFCGCKNDPFHASAPNIHTCPVCLGMPGALPVANRTAIEWTIKLGLALNCKINLFSKFDRKHYFYPDLPKGYQISQYDQPFCYDGFVETSQGKVRIRRIHLEEDTAKLQHTTIDGKKVSLVDFNRSSVPLIEIVTEPDIKSGEQAKEYGKQLRQIIRYLDIGDCDMEQGGMRLEANISVADKPYDGSADFVLPAYKVEVKNINSFRFLEQAINFEINRHSELLKSGEVPVQETRGFDSVKNVTFSQRTKESAEDYRYFPDPDLPPIEFTPEFIETVRTNLPELPAQVVVRWQSAYDLQPVMSLKLLTSTAAAAWYDQVLAAAAAKNITATKIINALINKKITAQVGDPVASIISQFEALTSTDTVDDSELAATIQTVLTANPDAVEKYKAGKTAVIGFLIGQVMRTAGKKLDHAQVLKAIEQSLAG